MFSKVKIENQIINEETVSILIADDRKLVREAWRCVLSKNEHFRIVSECNNWESALIQAKRLHPDVIILNIGPPDLSGIEMIPLLISTYNIDKILSFPVCKIFHQISKSNYTFNL